MWRESMKRQRIFFITALCLVCLPGFLGATKVIREEINFLNQDGISYVRYYTTRSDYSYYNIHWGNNKDLSRYLYIYPNDFTWEERESKDYYLHFSQGDYAFITEGDLSKSMTRDKDGIYTYQSWDGKKRADGHFGYWNTPDLFAQFVYAWVFPENFEVVDYESNRDGKWIKRKNTLTFYGSDLNNITFTIKYRHTTQKLFDSLKEGLQGQDEIEVEQLSNGVKVTIADKILFPSGSHELSDQGKDIITKVVASLNTADPVHIAVQGHTDNQPIRGKLAETFPTNWELSAARALTVVHHLSSGGIPEKQLEARACGEQRPKASNETEAGRAQNRRVEILIERIEK